MGHIRTSGETVAAGNICQRDFPCLCDSFVLAGLEDACEFCAPSIDQMRKVSGFVPVGRYFRSTNLTADQVQRIDAAIAKAVAN